MRQRASVEMLGTQEVWRALKRPELLERHSYASFVLSKLPACSIGPCIRGKIRRVLHETRPK